MGLTAAGPEAGPELRLLWLALAEPGLPAVLMPSGALAAGCSLGAVQKGLAVALLLLLLLLLTRGRAPPVRLQLSDTVSAMSMTEASESSSSALF
jgi:hypothetical protein